MILALLVLLPLGFQGLAHAQTDDPPPDNDAAMRWWDALDTQQRVAALHGDDATPEQRTAAESAYTDLDADTKSLVNDATEAINGNVDFSSVGGWWQSLDCRLKRVAAGEGNTEDTESPYCAHYPGSGRTPLLGASEMTHVDRIGQALLGRTDTGVYPADILLAMRWWNALEPAQRVAALHGDAATPEESAAAERAYEDLDPETKRRVHTATIAIAPTTRLTSVGAWWEFLDCRLKRIATGDGNTEDPDSPYCAFYPGSGVSPLLGADEMAHVDRIGQAFLDLMDPGVYPPDIVPAMNWWAALDPTQRVLALHGSSATQEESAAARNDYADLDPQTKRRVNDTAFDVFNGGGFDSVGAWWQSLECRLRRVAAGEGNAEDAESPYCAHYPGSGQSPLLDDMARQHVDAVGMALLGLSDTGVYPPARDRIGQVNRVLLPAVSRAILSSTVNAVSDRVNSRLSSPSPPTARLNLGGASNTPVAPTTATKATGDGRTDLARFLARSSFVLNAFGNSPSGLALWGHGAYRNLSGDTDGIDWEGNVVSGHFGSDVLLKRNVLAGLSLSHSKGTLDYTERIGVDSRQGDHETTLTSLHPYAGWMLDSGIGVWAMAGHGWGRVRINHDDAEDTSASDLTQWSGAVGANGTVYSSSELLPGGETAVALKGEGALARAEVHGSADIDELTSTVSRLRVALEGKHTRRFDSGGLLTPSVELGVLADGGTGETGAGLEVGGGLRYREPSLGLTVEARGRTLIAHGGEYEEWAAGGSLRLDPGVSGQGLSVSLAPSWGLWRSGIDRLWERGLTETGTGSPDPAMRMAGELSYGLFAFRGAGVLTPYIGFSRSGGSAREYRTGARLRTASSLTLALQGTRRERTDESIEHGVTVQAALRW